LTNINLIRSYKSSFSNLKILNKYVSLKKEISNKKVNQQLTLIILNLDYK
jgi:hypothetical protein